MKPSTPRRGRPVISRSLCLPSGYQSWAWYKPGPNPDGVYLNSPQRLYGELEKEGKSEVYLYTQHQIFHEEGILKHTRSSPQWDGGVVTYATCKHLMRTARRPNDTWTGTWLMGLCPKDCAANCVLFVGKVATEYPHNASLAAALRTTHPRAYQAKRALLNPRGDLYDLLDHTADVHNHVHYREPTGHTRQVECYTRSPGSVSERPDGKIPKWWRDLEYLSRTGRRPPLFRLDPCYLFSKPMLWTQFRPLRAVFRLRAAEVLGSLRSPR
jgi:hypothetical protein